MYRAVGAGGFLGLEDAAVDAGHGIGVQFCALWADLIVVAAVMRGTVHSDHDADRAFFASESAFSCGAWSLAVLSDRN